MPGKIDLYNLGSLGVNTTASPVHGEDGSFTSAQNAVPNTRGEAGAVVKRDGLVAVNSVAASGSIRGIINSALTAVTTRSLYVSAHDAANWRVSTDGFATITNTASLQGAPDQHKFTDPSPSPFDDLQMFRGRAVSDGKKIIYPGNTYTQYPAAGHTPPNIRMWDGTTDRQIGLVPYNPTIAATSNSLGVFDMLLDGTTVYFSVWDGGTYSNFNGRVFSLDTTTYALKQIGESFGAAAGELAGGTPAALALHGGYLWAGTGFGTNGAGGTGKVYRIRPTVDTAWTLDTTFAANESVVSLVSYSGLLYAGLYIDAAAVARLMVRSAAGAWSASTTTGGTPGTIGSSWTSLTVFGTNLYAGRLHSDSPNSASSIHKYDGSSWTNVKTLTTASASPLRVLGSFVHNGVLYFSSNVTDDGIFNSGRISYSSNGSSWTDLTTGNAAAVTGRMGVVIT